MSEHKLFASDPIYQQDIESIDEVNGIIRGVKVCSEGEARGHGVYLNKKFISNVVEQGKAHTVGIKARFGHPNMCSTALGTYIGRYKNYRTVREEKDGYEDIEGFGRPRKSGYRHHAVADLHLDKTAKSLPKLGNAWGYIMNLARTSPDMFGNSIVFTPGVNEVYEWEDEETKEKKSRTDATLKALIATDLVDSPAATDGLFENFSSDELALQVTQFLDEHPEVYKLATDHPEIVDTFLTKYAEYKTVNEMEPTKLTSMFDDLKKWISEHFVKAEKKEDIPDEVTTKLAEFEKQIAELSEAEPPEDLTPKVDELSGQVKKLESERDALKEKMEKAVEEVKRLEGELTKANAQSTHVEGPEGMEDDDGKLNPEAKALKNDLINLRNELAVVRPDSQN